MTPVDASELLRPTWPAPAHVRAVCSTRAGGVSLGPYDSLNLGDHVGDDPAAVAINRARFAAALGARPVFLRQVHGLHVATLDGATPDGTQADACLTRERALACTIMVADCLPLLLCDDEGRVVGAAHAGWRGLAGAGAPGPGGGGVIEALLLQMAGQLQLPPAEAARRMLVWLGPCIGPQAFEVGDEVRAAFVAHDPAALAHFTAHAPGKWLADLPGLARQRLRALGVTRLHGNDSGAAWCTVGNASRFFSYRRDGVSGRLAASIWRL
jgi:YfiH family protein